MNVREKTKRTLYTIYIRSMVTLLRIQYYTLCENHVSRLCRPLSAPLASASVCATLIRVQANTYIRTYVCRTCSHSYVGMSSRRRGVDVVDENNRRKWGRNSGVTEDGRNVFPHNLDIPQQLASICILSHKLSHKSTALRSSDSHTHIYTHNLKYLNISKYYS